MKAPRHTEELPPYIWNGQLVAQGPIKMRTSLTTFVFEASAQKQQALCDRYLNLPGSPTHYRPLGPHVVFYCARLDQQGPVDNPIGLCPEKDFGFWVPLIARDSDGSERHVVYTPWIWVDSPVAMIGGREVFGFSKELARLGLPDEEGGAGEYSLDTLVLPEHHPEQELVERRLITVRSQAGPSPMLRSFLASGRHLLQTLDQPLAAIDALRTALQRQELRMVFLKQFPDAADATRACYQAIVETVVRITGNLRGGMRPGCFEMTVAQHASHPIVDTLGLRPRRRTAHEAQISSSFGLWFSFDSQVEPGDVIYDAVAGWGSGQREPRSQTSEMAA